MVDFLDYGSGTRDRRLFYHPIETPKKYDTSHSTWLTSWTRGTGKDRRLFYHPIETPKKYESFDHLSFLCSKMLPPLMTALGTFPEMTKGWHPTRLSPLFQGTVTVI